MTNETTAIGMYRAARSRVQAWLIEHRRRCSTCGQRFSAPHCSLNRDLGWSGHTVYGGHGHQEPSA